MTALLLFDEDGRNYIVYGNDEIWITELNEDLTAQRRTDYMSLVSDHKNPEPGYEGSHIQKNKRLLLYFSDSFERPLDADEACFYSDSLKENSRVEMYFVMIVDIVTGRGTGGIVDTDGKWYAMLFPGFRAVGRIPILLPVT